MNDYSQIKEKILCDIYKISEKKGRSKTWDCFGFIKDENDVELENLVACRMCKNVYKYSRNALSNLSKHRCVLDLVKYELENELVEPNQEAKKACTDSLTEWILGDIRPYSLVKDYGLKAYSKLMLFLGTKFGPNLNVESLIPQATTICQNVENSYSTLFLKLKSEISSIREIGYALTCDLWTENFSNISYLALTAHFVMDGQYKNKLLGLKSMNGVSNTSQNISEKIEDILENYNCKISAKSNIVTSGCGDIIKFQTIPCITHLLNNALQKSIEDVSEVANLISTCIKLGNFLETKNYNTFPNLMQSFCPSRWISVNRVLKLIEINWIEINEILESKGEEARAETININHLKGVVEVLGQFEEALYVLEKDSDATLHLVIIYLHELKKFCDRNDSENKSADSIKTLKNMLRLRVEHIITKDVTITHKLALFLYPPTKKLLLFSEEEKECIEQECRRLMKCFENEVAPYIKQEPDFTGTCESKRRKIFSDFVESETNNDINELIMRELQFYKITRVVMNSEDFDVFGWWEQQRDNFPFLYKLSCIVLAPPASSIVAQRILTSAGSLLCDKISGLGSDETNVEHLAFIKCNAEQDEPEVKNIVGDDQI